VAGTVFRSHAFPDRLKICVWYGIPAPAKLRDETVRRIGLSLDHALNDDAFRASLEKIGLSGVRFARRR